MKTLKDLKDMDHEDLLGLLGLESRRPAGEQWLAALGTFAAGAVLGAGVALLFAPSSGRELRAELKSRLSKLPEMGPVEPSSDEEQA